MYKYYYTPYGCFRPLTGISLFLSKMLHRSDKKSQRVFVPSRGFLFFYDQIQSTTFLGIVFVPSRGFLFFYYSLQSRGGRQGEEFSSPHGDFSFSIGIRLKNMHGRFLFSSPHGDFSFSIGYMGFLPWANRVFVPSRGFLFFYIAFLLYNAEKKGFSSPHGDFSFSMGYLTSYGYMGFVFVPSRGFLFFYPISYSPYKSRAIFIICGANIFKPSECYF